MFDVLYNNRICNLVYMQDLPKDDADSEAERQPILVPAASATSELIVPLQEIVALLEHLLAKCQNNQREALQTIIFGAHKVDLFVRSLALNQSLKTKTFSPLSARFPIKEALKKFVQLYQFHANQKNIELALSPMGSLKANVNMDGERFATVLAHALSAAIKLSDRSQKVNIEIQAPDRGLLRNENALHCWVHFMAQRVILEEQ